MIRSGIEILLSKVVDFESGPVGVGRVSSRGGSSTLSRMVPVCLADITGVSVGDAFPRLEGFGREGGGPVGSSPFGREGGQWTLLPLGVREGGQWTLLPLGGGVSGLYLPLWRGK